jgi:pimeloyl-ACP methyl ester carboxylesterase
VARDTLFKDPERQQTPAQLFLADARRVALKLYGTVLPESASAWLERRFHRPDRVLMPDNAYRFFTDNHAQWVDYGTRRLFVWSWGDGPTILCLHGWNGRGAQFHKFVNALLTKGYRVVAYDGPAHGMSSGDRSNVLDMAGAALEIGRYFAPVHAVVAHSLGAPAATLAMRYGLEAKKLLFFSPAASLSEQSAQLAGREGLPPDIAHILEARLEHLFEMPIDELATHKLVRGLNGPEGPEVAVFHDEYDEQVSWHAGARIAQAAERGHLVTTFGLGHAGALDHRGTVDQAVEFLIGS